MQETNIGWTDFSSNLLKYRDPDGNVVHACIRVSPGCLNCYACAIAGRWGRKGKDFTASNMKRLIPFFDEEEAGRLLRSKKLKGKRLFPNDMTDWMGPWVPDEIVDQIMVTFLIRTDATIQTLTKHADRQLAYFTDPNRLERWNDVLKKHPYKPHWLGWWTDSHWPTHARHVHIGTSVEDQKRADERIPLLLQTPAAVRWISAEPLLGSIDLENANPDPNYFTRSWLEFNARTKPVPSPLYNRLDWCVVGGESGPERREMNTVWLTNTVDQCQHAKVPVYVKQDSALKPGQQGRIPNEYWLKEFPK